MASNTENLNLLMKNPSTDGADTFNVQTMLNDNWQKIDNNAGTVAQTLANILKPTTPPIIGLPPSATPDGMFQALGNTGELHVWRKTVVSDNEKPAGYTLGEVHSGGFRLNHPSQSTGGQYVTYKYSSELSVSETGVLSLGGTINSLKINDGTITLGSSGNALLGKFCIATSSDQRYLPEIPVNTVVFFPNDAVISGGPVIDKYQSVTGYPLTPAGTITTYPVSTNPNAYQEGSDAKPAGYTLGEVVTGKVLASKCYNNTAIYYGKSVSVSDDGIVSILNPTTRTLSSTLSSAEIAAIKDSFVYFSGNENYSDVSSAFRYGNIVYIPADASVSTEYANSAYGVYIDRYQPVTGYAAIPAGTTIEYLGKLGDKARVQVVSYVGTGTYGINNKNQLTFSGKPRFVMVPGAPFGYAYIPNGNFYYATTGDYITLEDLHCVWNDDTNTMTWYHPSYPYRQYNQSGTKYTFVAIY